MLLRMSSLFLRTLRDDPADAEVPSHKLLVRAGYVRRVAPGIYSWLPLGKLVLENVTKIVREEMNRMGGQEVLFPALLPREYYEATGRWTEYGDLLFRLQDRKGADYLLGPTHEELFTDLVKGEYSSYKDYPVTLYQIQTKYRDEARPRAGILRGREFVMKDSYSFDLDDDGLKRSYEQHRETYIRTFDRLGIDYKIVFAQSGAMGGSASEEFLAPPRPPARTPSSPATPAATPPTPKPSSPPRRPPSPSTTRRRSRSWTPPDTPTIESLVSHVNEHHGLSITAADTLKNVVVKVVTPGSDKVETLVIGVPGDREVDFKRLEAALSPGEPAIFEAEDFAKHPGLVRGYIGPQVLRGLGIRYLVDPPRRHRHRLGHRRQRAGQARRRCGRGPRLRPRRHHRGRRGPRRRPPARAAAPSCPSTAASRSATSSSSAANTLTRPASTRSAPTASPSASPWAPTASASPARWP
ncbi:aminoacyl--tRNA ligase-related protein [Nonomuraea salmonea]|uniref:aminoacyl--tRNA ligase-related protein n=1 Tax=Nonomuraea salmonea TaxID=46181 RepID=UPI002FEB1C9B